MSKSRFVWNVSVSGAYMHARISLNVTVICTELKMTLSHHKISGLYVKQTHKTRETLAGRAIGTIEIDPVPVC